LPQEIPAANALRSELIEFYTSRGFRLFGRAYSQYANTYISIAHLLNFTAGEGSRGYALPGAESEWDLEESAYFEMLQQRGYRLPVYQSTYMDLCHAKGVQPQECTTYPAASLRTLQDLKLPAIEKARAIAGAVVAQSQLLEVVNKFYERWVRAAALRIGW